LIVVDNNSVDNTLEIAARYADIVTAWGPERSAQRNRGAKIATGDYLFFVDSDMILQPNVVAECLEAQMTERLGGIIVPELTVGDGYWTSCRRLERACYASDNLVEAARFFSRQSFLAAGGYDERLTGVEDWDLSIRLTATKGRSRITSKIIHDEGRIRLIAHVKKKAYYGRSIWPYWTKHKGRALRQANMIGRSSFVRNWRLLLRHPVLTAGLVTLKLLESFAMFFGALFGLRLREWRSSRSAALPPS
jgi:glycosyltransferase involved in cell wall biosynthesis